MRALPRRARRDPTTATCTGACSGRSAAGACWPSPACRAQPQHFYFGAVNGGVWETLDAGRTWQPIFDGQPVGSIGALAVAPSDPQRALRRHRRSRHALGHRAGRRHVPLRRRGQHVDDRSAWPTASRSDASWSIRAIPTPCSSPRSAIPYGPNAERGVFRSRDGGAHWQRVLGKGDDTGAIDLAFEPGNPQVVYAALWQTRRTPWNVYPPASGPGSGLYKSIDGGDSWTRLRGNGFPRARRAHRHRASRRRAVARLRDRRWRMRGGLYRSDDAGAHWRRASDDARIWQRGWYFGRHHRRSARTPIASTR